MATETLTRNITLVTVECCVCGITFAVPKEWNRSRIEKRDFWHCPNGHAQHYSGETDAEKLRKRLANEETNTKYWRERAREEIQEKERVVRSRAAIKGQLTKTKKRIAAGVCPCCNRHFTNLERHMEAKHPHFTADEHEDAEHQEQNA